MINQVVANPDYTSTSNQYGFYALPKTVKPKTKYREPNDEEEDSDSNVEEVITPLQEQPEDQRKLERDYFVNEAPWPQYREKEPGLDIGIQVEDGDLFDYEHEVKPLLEILVGQTLVKARSELQEESEIQERQKKLSDFSKKRNAELMVTQRLEAQRKRKTEEAERRVLQHKVHHEQKKALLKKIISHKQSKAALMGLRSEILYDLEQEGLLRNEPYLNLRTQFEPWLYETIMDCLEEQEDTKRAVGQICDDKHKQLSKKHSEYIQRENQRRKEILDQRERERLAEEDRKKRRAIKKHRKALNAARTERQEKFYQATSKGEKLDSIAKAEIADGQMKPRPVAYVSGGVIIHVAEVLDVLSQLGVNLTNEQTEDLLMKVIGQLSAQVEIPVSRQVESQINESEASMKQDFGQFHKKRDQVVERIVNSGQVIAGDVRRALNVQIKPQVLKSLATAILNIYLSMAVPEEKPQAPAEPAEGEPAQEQPEQQPAEPAIVLTERENQRLAVRNNLVLTYEDPNSFSVPEEVVRIRVPLQRPEEEEEQPADPEYIEIFDGQGWQRTTEKYPQREDPSSRQPRSYNLTGFERTYVYDEIANHHFETWLVSLLQVRVSLFQRQGIQAPEEFAAEMLKRNSLFERIGERLGKDDSIAVYDYEAEE